MSDRRTILGWSVRLSLAALGLAGLALLLVPSIARALGWSGDLSVWPWGYGGAATPVQQNLLADAGLQVTADQWRRNRNQWERLGEGQRSELLKRYARLQELDETRRKAVVTEYEKLVRLPPTEREQLRRQAAGLAGFEAALSRQDLVELDSLTPERRARRLIELWRASKGLE
jgi:hypothetical protein